MNRKSTILLVAIMVAAGFVLGIVASTVKPSPVHEDREPVPPPSDLVFTVKLIVSFVNLALILALLIIYIDIYWTVRSRFTVGLIVAISALLVYAVTSNPLFSMLLGYQASGPGPFMFIPDMFTALAASVLIYLSTE